MAIFFATIGFQRGPGPPSAKMTTEGAGELIIEVWGIPPDVSLAYEESSGGRFCLNVIFF